MHGRDSCAPAVISSASKEALMARPNIPSKHDILTEEEFSTFTPNERLVHYLDSYRRKRNLREREINVLDWGCGRGRETLWLREHGYNAYGIDIDPEPIRNGLYLFQEKGYEASSLVLVSPEGKTDFPDNFFHFTFSNEVFEHVEHMESVAAEIARITASDGMGYHAYPAHRHIVEVHLLMPFLHWLPKNRLRKYFIFVCVCLGREPRWRETENSRLTDKVGMYYKYSNTGTYYRSYSHVRRVFEDNGFIVSFETIRHPRVQNNRLIGKLANFNASEPLVNHLLLTFKSCELLLHKF